MRLARLGLLAVVAIVAVPLGCPLLQGPPLTQEAEGMPQPRASSEPAVQPMAAGQARPTAAAVPAPQPTGVSPVSPVSPMGHWELCGLGRVPIPAGGAAPGRSFGTLPELPAHLGEHAMDEALRRVLGTLRQGSERQQAVASLWAAGPARAPGLAALASRSPDAAVLAMALQLCRVEPQERACAQLQPQAQAVAEPDNLHGWLLWAALRPQDEPQWGPGALASRRYTQRQGLVPQTLMGALPADAPPYLGVLLAIEGIGVEAALPDVTLTTATRLCRPPQPGTRAPLCQHMARVLAESSDTLLGKSVGTRLGEWAAWPEHRLAAARHALRTAEADEARFIEQLSAGPQPLDCAGVQRWRAHVDAAAVRGPR